MRSCALKRFPRRARDSPIVKMQNPLIVQSFSGRRVEYGVALELFGAPWRRVPSQVLLKPLEMGRVIQCHFVPARPVPRILIDDQSGRNVHFLLGSEEFQRLGVRYAVIPFTRNHECRRFILAELPGIGGGRPLLVILGGCPRRALHKIGRAHV